MSSCRLSPLAAAATLLLTLFIAPLAGQLPTPSPARHVVLISVDGLRPEFYLDSTWPAPMLQQMAREGTHAKGVVSVFPSVTYSAHTTMVTGALPARHGVYYNAPFEPGGETGRWYWEADLIEAPTLWDAAREAGLESASLSWPVSVGAPVDRNLPEIWSLTPERDAIAALRESSTPPGLWQEIEREATGRLTLDNFNYGVLTRDDRAGDVAAYLLATYRPALMTVHLIETDDFQHREGRQGKTVPRAVAAADRAISQMVEAAERAGILEQTAFVVSGDHGFIDHQVRVNPNVWLVEAGLMENAKDRGEWRAAFHTSAAAAFLHLADPEDRDAVRLAREALARLPANRKALFRVIEREELDRRGAAPEAIFALAPTPGATFESGTAPPAVAPASGANHGHLPELPQMHTGFVGWGAGIRIGGSIERMGLVDVAPIVAALLGLDFDAPDGTVPAGILAE